MEMDKKTNNKIIEKKQNNFQRMNENGSWS